MFFQLTSAPDPTSAVRIGSTYVLPVTSVRDFGLYIDCDVSLQTHVNATVRRSERITPLLRELNWLRVPERITFRL